MFSIGDRVTYQTDSGYAGTVLNVNPNTCYVLWDHDYKGVLDYLIPNTTEAEISFDQLTLLTNEGVQV